MAAFVFVPQFKAGPLLLAYEIRTRHKRIISNLNTLCVCVWGGGGGGVGLVDESGHKCYKPFICLFLIGYGEIIHTYSKVFV